MANYKMYGWALALVLWLASCNSDNEIEESVVEEVYQVEVSVSFPKRGHSFLHQGWENACLAALRTDYRSVDKTELKKEADDVFVGVSKAELTEDSDFALFYPASASTVATSDTLTQNLYINEQEGTLSGVAVYDYAWGEYNVSEDFSVEMSPLMSLAKFQFQSETGGSVGAISQVLITAPSGVLYSYGTFNLKDGDFNSLNAGSIRVKSAEGLPGEVYVAFFPEDNGASLHFTVMTIDGKVYEASLPEPVRFEAGADYEFEPLVCSSLPLARVGDYFYSDATWSSELDAHKKCVGVVFALNDAHGNLDSSVEASAYGRVVALKDCTTQVVWSYESLDREEMDNYAVLKDTISVGSLPYYKGTADSFYSDVAMEQLGEIKVDAESGRVLSWYKQDALSHWRGEESLLALRENVSQFPPFSGCYNYREGLYGWYLPSAGELALLWSLHRLGMINEESHEGFVDFDTFGYWSSTECDETRAWYVNFYSGMIVNGAKPSKYNARAVFRF